MKRCTYCGKEYPNDVSICSLDQAPVTPEGKVAPVPKLPRVNNREHLASRPASVKFAVGLLAFSIILDLIILITKYQSGSARTRDFYSMTAFTFGFSGLFVYLIFRGKNWARWVVACAIAAGILLGPFRRIGPARWETYFFTLADIIAVIGLFQRSSNEWFRGTKSISLPPNPVS